MKYKNLVVAMFLMAVFFIGYLIVVSVQAFQEQEQHNKNVIENITIFSDEVPQSSGTINLTFNVIPPQ